MVAIVSAGGLGLERSSGSLLGSRGTLGSAALGRALDDVTVNAATGNLIIQNTDEVLIGRGPNTVVNRTYNSLGTYAGDTDNWLHNGQRKVVLTGTANAAGSTATLTDWDGSVVAFSFVSAAVGYQANENPYRDDMLKIASNIWTWTEGKSRRVETFANANGGRITSAADADGNTITYAYTGTNLTKITTADNTTAAPIKNSFTTLTYDASNNLTSLVTSYYDTASNTNKTLTRTRYAYDANRLSSVTVDLTPGDNAVTDAKTYVTNYTYDGASKRVTSIAQTDGTLLSITYDGIGRVASFVQTVETGVTRAISFTYGVGFTSITDPQSNVTKMSYDVAGRLLKIEEPPAVAGGNPTFKTFDYDASFNLLSTATFSSLAELNSGAVTTREWLFYDAVGNVIESYKLIGAGYETTKFTYGTKNELLSEIRYAGLDPDGQGGVAPVGAMTTRYVYDSINGIQENHLRFMISAEGRVTEYLYDGSSQTAATTVNGAGQLTTTIVYNNALYTTAGTPTEAQMMTWRSAANMPDKTNVLRTDTAYDYRGNVTTVTTYEKVDSNGNNSFGLGYGDYSRTIYVYDQYGKLISKLVNDGSQAETYAYDGLGRTIRFTDAKGMRGITRRTSRRTSAMTLTAIGGCPNMSRRAAMMIMTGRGITTAQSLMRAYSRTRRRAMMRWGGSPRSRTRVMRPTSGHRSA